MSVIPLTLTISLCLVFTFVLFFMREQSRRRFDSTESDALLPLAEETPVLARTPHHHHGQGSCRGDHACASCQKRKTTARA